MFSTSHFPPTALSADWKILIFRRTHFFVTHMRLTWENAHFLSQTLFLSLTGGSNEKVLIFCHTFSLLTGGPKWPPGHSLRKCSFFRRTHYSINNGCPTCPFSYLDRYSYMDLFCDNTENTSREYLKHSEKGQHTKPNDDSTWCSYSLSKMGQESRKLNSENSEI